MKRSPALLLALALSAAPGADASPIRYKVAAPSKVTFDAASSLHGFYGGSDEVTGSVTYDPEAPLESSGEVVIDATSLKTGDRKRDSKMRGSALEVGKFPRITMRMTRFVPSEGGAPGEGNIHGELELHGVTKKLLVPATITPGEDGRLQVSGKVGLDMRNWDIDPPVNRILFVTVRVLPNVTVGFELTLEPQDDPELEERLNRIEALKEKLQGS